MTEQEIAKILIEANEEFRKLGDEHKHLEGMLSEFNSKKYLTSEEELEKKRIQKLKLSKKDRMAEIIRDYKKSHPAN